MKIYIDKFNEKALSTYMNSFNSPHINLFTKYFIKTEKLVEIYSDEGIFVVDNNNIHKIIYNDKPIIHVDNYYQSIKLLIDQTTQIKESVSQLPFNHIILNTTKYIFSSNHKTKIFLIIETNSDNINEKNIIDNDNSVYNVYFNVPNDADINNPFIKEELNVFLSLLN